MQILDVLLWLLTWATVLFTFLVLVSFIFFHHLASYAGIDMLELLRRLQDKTLHKQFVRKLIEKKQLLNYRGISVIEKLAAAGILTPEDEEIMKNDYRRSIEGTRYNNGQITIKEPEEELEFDRSDLQNPLQREWQRLNQEERRLDRILFWLALPYFYNHEKRSIRATAREWIGKVYNNSHKNPPSRK